MDTLKVPVWLIGILVSMLLALLGTVFYAGQTYGQVKSLDQRLSRIETGVDQLWQRAIVGPVQ